MATDPTPADALELSGQVVAVTGATGGIGTGIARRFAAAGAEVLVHHRTSADRATELCASLPTRATSAQVDLTDPDGPERLVAAAIDAYGHLDILVNNAGVQPVTPLTDVTDDEWDVVLGTDLTAVHRCTQAFAHHRRAEGGGGAVVNIASIEGVQPATGHAHYATAKAALRMYTRAAAAELGTDGIRVNTVSPGLIDRPGLAEDWPEGVARWEQAAPLGRLGRPQDVGDACVFLASGLARFITGAELLVDGGVLTRSTW